MTKTAKILIGAGLALSLSVPLFTQAATLSSDQLNSVLSLLQSYNVAPEAIQSIKGILSRIESRRPRQMMATSTANGEPAMNQGQAMKAGCIALNRTLGVGSQGDDVRQLQQVLAQDPKSGFTGTTTGVFGPMTARALRHFEEENGIGSSTEGMAGPELRGFFEHRCGKGLGGGERKGSGEDRGRGDRGGDQGGSGQLPPPPPGTSR